MKMIGAICAMTVALAGCAIVVVTQSGGSSSSNADAGTAIKDFFARYVDPDGRVVRHDQGGDTVSEGQSYALLLAAATNDRAHFDQVWAWTASHLQRADGLLSWRYADGAVTDAMSAADGDLNSAWALTLASRRFAAEPYASDARRLGGAILDQETVTAAGRRYLAAGPWATSDPAVVDPSYAVPQAFVELGRLTGDSRWSELAATSRASANDDQARGALPPDWMTVDLGSGHEEPIASPNDRIDAPAFGLDATRLTAWLAADCDPASQADAAGWAGKIVDDQPLLQRHTLAGDPASNDKSAASEATTALGELAAGDRDHADRLFADASAFDGKYPTYYGAAWLALGLTLAEPQTPLSCTSR